MKLIKEEEKDHKTLVKEYKRLEIFITIFMSIAICLGTFYFNVICFGTECENKSPTPLIIIKAGERNTEKSGEKNEVSENAVAASEEEKLPEWMEYILKQDIRSITIDRSIINETQDGEIRKNVVLQTSDLRKIFEKIKDDTFTKGKVTGFAADDSDTLNITYVADGITFNFSIFNLHFSYIRIEKINDANLISLLEKSVTAIDTTLGDTGSDVYVFNKDFSSIYDEYFN